LHKCIIPNIGGNYIPKSFEKREKKREREKKKQSKLETMSPNSNTHGVARVFRKRRGKNKVGEV